jgi:hypothetical protein
MPIPVCEMNKMPNRRLTNWGERYFQSVIEKSPKHLQVTKLEEVAIQALHQRLKTDLYFANPTVYVTTLK